MPSVRSVGKISASGSADGGRGRFGKAEVADFAHLDQRGHGTDSLLDRNLRIDAVLIVEIDDVDLEPLEAGIDGVKYVLPVAAHAEELALRAADVAELRGQEHILAAARDRLSDQLLVVAGAVHVGGIDEVAAGIEKVMDHANRLRVTLAARSVELAHAHGAEAERRDAKPLSAELTLNDGCFLHVLNIGPARGFLNTRYWRSLA
jgi:hypothetical protein